MCQGTHEQLWWLVLKYLTAVKKVVTIFHLLSAFMKSLQASRKLWRVKCYLGVNK
ncbi:hypothetical protein LP032_085 [Listeria phage LP-032]|nr:hypothetical protein LP026_076 [Listeria phage LP-026]AHL18934.1 hypothetical protein LP032_085 [Listeria phage LP-032]AHN84770.1 hypothetical protein LP026_076 [Listeria phage LP-026]